jgi:hypothetical protein
MVGGLTSSKFGQLSGSPTDICGTKPHPHLWFSVIHGWLAIPFSKLNSITPLQVAGFQLSNTPILFF